MKKVYLSYHDIHTDSIKLANKIKNNYKPKKLIIISQEGLIPSSIIANYLKIKDINFIDLKLHHKKNKSSKSKIVEKTISHEKLLVIDTITDDETTSNLIKKIMPNSTFAVLYTKISIKKKEDLSLYNFKKNDLIIFPWESKKL